MTASRISAGLSTATLCLVVSLGVGLVGCGGSSSHGDGSTGAGGAAGPSDGSAGGATGGHGGTSGAPGGDAGTDVAGRLDAGNDLGLVLVDARGNNFTCADLLACCNSITNATDKATCMQGYALASASGNASCNNVLTQIKAMTAACQ
jgi:hypothetical protein